MLMQKKQVLNIFTFSLTFISSKIPSFHKNFLISPIFMMTELAWNSFQVLICSGQTSTIIRQFYGTLHGSTDRSTTDWRPHSIIKHFLEFLPRNMSLSLLYLYLEIFSPLSISLSFLVMPCGRVVARAWAHQTSQRDQFSLTKSRLHSTVTS